MTRYSGTCILLSGVSYFALGSAACVRGSDTGDPMPASSDDESALSLVPDEGPALTVGDSVLRATHSTLPTPPDDHIPRPAGRPGNLRVLDWAGFRGAVSYTFDDS